MLVMLSEAKHLCEAQEILRFAQDDGRVPRIQSTVKPCIGFTLTLPDPLLESLGPLTFATISSPRQQA